jgi:FkbM family methyltransferase
MKEFLNSLKKVGFNPTNILDIGAHHGHWSTEAHSVFEEANMTMVEPIDYPELKRFDDNDKFSYRNVLLDERRWVRDWFEKKNTGDSIFRETTGHFENCIPQKRMTTTLDDEFFEHFSTGPELIKMDTQGAEIPILKGGKIILKNNQIIIMEIPFVGVYNENVPNFSAHVQFMDEIGYTPLGIADELYHSIGDYSFCSTHLDLAFIRKSHAILKEQQNKISNMGR